MPPCQKLQPTCGGSHGTSYIFDLQKVSTWLQWNCSIQQRFLKPMPSLKHFEPSWIRGSKKQMLRLSKVYHVQRNLLEKCQWKQCCQSQNTQTLSWWNHSIGQRYEQSISFGDWLNITECERQSHQQACWHLKQQIHQLVVSCPLGLNCKDLHVHVSYLLDLSLVFQRTYLEEQK